MALFFATRPSADAARRLVHFQARLRHDEPEIAGLRWTAERKLHYTLRYLGNVAEERVPALVEAATRAVAEAGTKAFTIEMRRLDAFPSRHRAQSIWVGAGAGVGELGGIASSLTRVLESLDFKADPRAFTAHLTLARMSDRVRRDAVADAIVRHRDVDLGTDVVDAIELMSSSREIDDGAAYATVARISLI